MIAALALLAVMQHDPDAAACTPSELRAAASDAEMSTLGRVAGDEVVLAGPHASCMCGNVNCPWYVLQLGASPPAVLLKTYGWAADPIRGNGALPGLRVRAHDSALITDETDYAFRGGTYVTAASYIVRGDTGARKAIDVPVRFAPGTSSAVLHGSVSIDWGDSYAFAAARGQHLTLGDVRAKPGVTFALSSADGTHRVVLAPGAAVTLPVSGTYALSVGTDAGELTPYAFTMTIR